MKCENCGATESKLWHSYEYEEDDTYGMACSEASVPTTFTAICHICDECETAPIHSFDGMSFDNMSVAQLDYLIAHNLILESDVTNHYNNSQWRDTP